MDIKFSYIEEVNQIKGLRKPGLKNEWDKYQLYFK